MFKSTFTFGWSEVSCRVTIIIAFKWLQINEAARPVKNAVGVTLPERRVMKHNFQLVAGHLALDFANTLDWRFDPERRVDLIPTYESFLEFAMQSGVILKDVETLLTRTSKRESFRTLRRAVDLRETLDCLFRSIAVGSSPSRSCLAKFNHFLADSRIPDFIIRRGSEFVCAPVDLSITSDGPLWPIV